MCIVQCVSGIILGKGEFVNGVRPAQAPADQVGEFVRVHTNRRAGTVTAAPAGIARASYSAKNRPAIRTAAPSGCVPSAAIKSECKGYYIKPELFAHGKTVLKTPAGNEVPAYGLARTICDVIRSRSKLGAETFRAALKQKSIPMQVILQNYTML